MQNEDVLKITINDSFLKEIARQEIRKILCRDEYGVWWNMKRLEEETCRKRDWLLDNILLNPRFREEMSLITNNCEGGRWMFKAKEMQSFLDKNFHHLNRNNLHHQFSERSQK